jgi:hypothetical protein
MLDEASVKRIGAVTDRDKVRKVLHEAMVMTAAYKASGMDVNATLDSSQSFFSFDSHANRQRVSDYLDAVAGLGLMDPHDIPSTLEGIDDFGTASLLLEVAYDDAACRSMFLDATGEPFEQGHYEIIGRQALLALISETDPDAFRRLPMRDDLWKRMRDAGQNFGLVLPPPITGGASSGVRLGVVTNDYLLIVWWAEAMAKAAKSLAEIRVFLSGRDATKLTKDKTFQKLRKDFADELAETVHRNKSNFGDPWGLLALYMCAERPTSVSALMVTPKLPLSFSK